MEFLMLFKKILTKGCIYYTVIITAFYTFGLLAESSSQWIPTLRIAYSLLTVILSGQIIGIIQKTNAIERLI